MNKIFIISFSIINFINQTLRKICNEQDALFEKPNNIPYINFCQLVFIGEELL